MSFIGANVSQDILTFLLKKRMNILIRIEMKVSHNKVQLLSNNSFKCNPYLINITAYDTKDRNF